MDFVVLDNSDAALTSNDVALEAAFPISEPELVVATPPQAETSKRDVIDSIKPTLNRLSIMLAVLFSISDQPSVPCRCSQPGGGRALGALWDSPFSARQ
jgi:hypothetical protein